MPRIGALWVSAQRLASLYRWSESDAAWFLLTGKPPMIPTVQGRIETTEGESAIGATITITALPHVSGKTVAAVFETAKRRLFGRRGPLANGRRTMAEFVKGVIAREGKRPPWPKLHERWSKKAPPEWRYADWRALRRAYAHEIRPRRRKS